MNTIFIMLSLFISMFQITATASSKNEAINPIDTLQCYILKDFAMRIIDNPSDSLKIILRDPNSDCNKIKELLNKIPDLQKQLEHYLQNRIKVSPYKKAYEPVDSIKCSILMDFATKILKRKSDYKGIMNDSKDIDCSHYLKILQDAPGYKQDFEKFLNNLNVFTISRCIYGFDSDKKRELIYFHVSSKIDNVTFFFFINEGMLEKKVKLFELDYIQLSP